MVPDLHWWTYILQCRDGSYYVGSTSDLASRIQVHQSAAGPRYTAARLPVRLVYSERHSTLQQAIRRERQIKRWSRSKKAALIAGDAATLQALSRCREVSRRSGSHRTNF
ncbi:MAG: GIY-YIG nuclease family protein [Pirellulales bacterium]|nr:GIY-YIG nuclease family protein [Pirellulales bacterium]